LPSDCTATTSPGLMKRIRPFTLKAIRGGAGLVKRGNGGKASIREAVGSGVVLFTTESPIGFLFGSVRGVRNIADAILSLKVVRHNTHLTAFRHSHYDPPT